MMMRSDIDRFISLRDEINSEIDHACKFYNLRRQELGLNCDEYHQWVNIGDWFIENYNGVETIVSQWTFFGSRGYTEEMLSYIPVEAIVDPTHIDKILNKEIQDKKDIEAMNAKFAEEKKQRDHQAKIEQFNKLKEELGL